MVTGGAGYIGSHTVLQLVARGERVVVLDDLSTGFRQAVRDVPLVVGNVGDRALVDSVLAEHRVDTIIHFAAHTIVPESVSDPLKYYGNNTCATRSLLDCAARAGVKHFVFSSTAAVYGIPANGLAAEDIADRADQSLRHLEADVGVDAARPVRGDADALRGPALLQRRRLGTRGRIGQSTRAATLLVKVACEVAVGKRPHLSVFGTDYPTPDGTGVRDYIHVEDLATAHVNALTYLRDGGKSLIANCGYGHGYSVREVVVERGEDRRHQARRCARSRAAPAIRRRWSPRPTRCARCSAGRPGSTTSTPSCAARSNGNGACSGNPGS